MALRLPITLCFAANAVPSFRRMSGSVITALPEVPEKAGYTGAWDYNNTPITADTKINAVYTLTEVEPDEPDEPVDNKAVFTPVEETPVNEAVIAIRSGDVFLSYESETGVVIETDEEGNVLAPAKNILWKVTDNGDGTVVFTNTVAGKQLAVFVDAEGNTRIGIVAGEEEINPGDDDIPGETTEQIEFLSETGDEGSTEPEVPTDPEESTGQVYTDWTITKLGSSFYLGITLDDGNDWHDHTQMLEAGFETYERVELCEYTNIALPEIAVLDGEQSRVRTTLTDKVFVTLPRSGAKIECKIEAISSLSAPVSRGQDAGEIVFTYESKEIARIPLVTAYAAAKKKEKGFWEKLFG